MSPNPQQPKKSTTLVKPDIQQKIRDYSTVLQKNNIPFESLFLFGSIARGTPHKWSDIDVAVVGPAFANDGIDETVRLSHLAYDIDPAISPIPLRPEDLEDRFSTIGAAIRREGIRIV